MRSPSLAPIKIFIASVLSMLFLMVKSARQTMLFQTLRNRNVMSTTCKFQEVPKNKTIYSNSCLVTDTYASETLTITTERCNTPLCARNAIYIECIMENCSYNHLHFEKLQNSFSCLNLWNTEVNTHLLCVQFYLPSSFWI